MLGSLESSPCETVIRKDKLKEKIGEIRQSAGKAPKILLYYGESSEAIRRTEILNKCISEDMVRSLWKHRE